MWSGHPPLERRQKDLVSSVPRIFSQISRCDSCQLPPPKRPEILVKTGGGDGSALRLGGLGLLRQKSIPLGSPDLVSSALGVKVGASMLLQDQSRPLHLV